MAPSAILEIEDEMKAAVPTAVKNLSSLKLLEFP
jgi:hypothetical protein